MGRNVMAWKHRFGLSKWGLIITFQGGKHYHPFAIGIGLSEGPHDAGHGFGICVVNELSDTAIVRGWGHRDGFVKIIGWRM
jgi:hypothetical protein